MIHFGTQVPSFLIWRPLIKKVVKSRKDLTTLIFYDILYVSNKIKRMIINESDYNR